MAVEDDFVMIASYPNPMEAKLARIHLEENGIRVFLADLEIVETNWLLGNAVGYIKLHVPQSDVAAAQTILNAKAEELTQKAKPAADADLDTDSDDETAYCLACGQKLPESESKCSVCGWSYDQESD